MFIFFQYFGCETFVFVLECIFCTEIKMFVLTKIFFGTKTNNFLLKYIFLY